ncbi:MAG TPA: hypothetical protein VM657_07530 [Sphingomonas sp.]|nr:hypothetical protein [Sphingomonas sp.]
MTAGRLILALLLACLALPATATMPCHDDAPAPMAGMTHHAPDAPDAAMPAHLCIGCVPPSSWRVGTITAPLLPAMPLAGRPFRASVAGPPLTPEPPPPRLA